MRSDTSSKRCNQLIESTAIWIVLLVACCLLAACESANHNNANASKPTCCDVKGPAADIVVRKSIRNKPIASALRGDGHSQSWDGRLFVVSDVLDENAAGSQRGWFVQVLRPERLMGDSDDLLNLADALSPRVSLYEQAEPLYLFGFSEQQRHEILSDPGSSAVGLTIPRALHLAPDPAYAVNPYASNATGEVCTALSGSNCQTEFSTYRFLVYSQLYASDPFNSENAALVSVAPAHVVVRNLHSNNADVVRAQFNGPFTTLRTQNNDRLRGIEPSVTFDGRLLLYQGHPDNDGKIDVLMYSWNPDPAASIAWSEPKTLSRMYFEDRNVDVDGTLFQDRWPLSKQPLRSTDGEIYQAQDLYLGAYPWISQDGSELFHLSTRVGPDAQGPMRAGLSVIGRLSYYSKNHVDGPLNQDRGYRYPNKEAPGRKFYSSPGLAPGFWQAFADIIGGGTVDTSWGHFYPVYGSTTSDYGELSFTDPDYLLYLHMNESITKSGIIQHERTPDTSRHNNSAQLQGAYFPQEYPPDGEDVGRGIIGQAIYFPPESALLIESVNGFEGLTTQLTVQFFVRLLTGSQAVDKVTIATLADELAIGLNLAQNTLVLQRQLDKTTQSASFALPKLDDSGETWIHLAITLDLSQLMLQLYVDGALLYEGDSAILEGWQQFDWANRRMLIGPTAQVDAEASTALYLLDEFALSNVSRTPTELRRDALLPSKQPVYAQSSGNTLPLGLDPQALRIPADKLPGEEKVALGKALFSDSRLSSNGLSCSSCHSPELAYTDAEALAIGHEGQQLQRSTPMAVNRAFGLSQSWDGQSTSLEDQVLRPFEDPMELATNLSDVLVFLNTDPDYSTRFKLTYKQAANRLNLADALASFQRALMSANSRVDRFEHGMDVLTDAEQRGRLLFAGKGRCTACHNGSNYSDELFHPSILTDSADLGRYAVSHRSNDHNAFKTPSLRNVELTAPYFHNGSVASLEEVVALYNEGGGASISQDIEIRPLGLNDAEKADLVAFLKALTGKIVEVRLLP